MVRVEITVCSCGAGFHSNVKTKLYLKKFSVFSCFTLNYELVTWTWHAYGAEQGGVTLALHCFSTSCAVCRASRWAPKACPSLWLMMAARSATLTPLSESMTRSTLTLPQGRWRISSSLTLVRFRGIACNRKLAVYLVYMCCILHL